MTQQTVLITGASSGIGYATALAFLQRGYHVAGTARQVASLRPLVEAAAPLPAEFLPLAADVRDRHAMQAVVRQTVDRFGSLGVLVANAGVGQRGGVVESEWDHVETVLRTNIDGVLHSIRAAVPAMQQGGGGHIVLLSSVVYNMTVPYAAYYAASKAFVSSIGRSLRLELEADHIRVTDMIVGRTDTNFNTNRLGGGRSGSGVPRMSPEVVAAGIVRGVERNQRQVFLRFFDRFTVWANLLIPDRIGRIALKQYK